MRFGAGGEATQQQLTARPQLRLPVGGDLLQIGPAEQTACPAQQTLRLLQPQIDDTGHELDRVPPEVAPNSRTVLR